MTQGLVVQHQQQLKKTLTVFIHHIVMDDRYLAVNQIADAITISRKWVENILHQELGCSKVHEAGHVTGKLGPFWDKSIQFSWMFLHTRLMLGLSLQGRDQTAIVAVETSFFSSKESQGGVICRKGGGLCLPRCKGYCVYWLPSERMYYQQRILCQLAEEAETVNQVKKATKTDERGPVSPGQCSCTQVCGCNGCCERL